MNKSKWTMLFVSNFLGVFNDNFLKNAIIFIAITWTLPSWLTHSQLISIVASGLVIPYLIFSPMGGILAVRYSKKRVFVVMKLIEIPIMLVAIIAFYFQWIYLAFTAIFIMGIQSSLYSPSKYSLIRDIGGKEGVSFGSGVFETMAFIGILLGSFFASLLSDHYTLLLFSMVVVGVAVMGFWTTKRIEANEQRAENEENSTYNPILFIKNNYQVAKSYHQINGAVIGSSSFWLLSNMLQMNVIIHLKNIYNFSNTKIGVVMALAAIGIAIGTGVTGYLSGSKVRKNIIIPALIIMSISLLAMTVTMPYQLFVALIILFAIVAGAFQVPNMALIQHKELGRKRGSIVAYLNMINFIFILIGTALFSIITAISKDNSQMVFVAMSILCVVVLLFFIWEKKRDNFINA